jgi:hypothetical protein
MKFTSMNLNQCREYFFTRNYSGSIHRNFYFCRRKNCIRNKSRCVKQHTSPQPAANRSYFSMNIGYRRALQSNI